MPMATKHNIESTRNDLLSMIPPIAREFSTAGKLEAIVFVIYEGRARAPVPHKYYFDLRIASLITSWESSSTFDGYESSIGQLRITNSVKYERLLRAGPRLRVRK